MVQGMSAPVVPVSEGSPAVVGRELPGIRVLVADFPASLHLSRHAHEHPTIAVVISGVFRKDVAGGVQEAAPGTLIAEPAGERHANWFGPRGARVVLLQPLRPREGDESSWRTLFSREPHVSVDPWSAELARRIARELSSPDDLSRLALEGLVLELAVSAARGRPPRVSCRAPAWLARVEELLRVEFIHPPSMQSLALEAGVHPVHLARVFRRHHGCTAASHVRKLRVAWAQQELLRPGATVTEVALAAGFSGQSHFTRAFRQILGLAPGRWRRSQAS
jgi:AraC family transcriptional regulator